MLKDFKTVDVVALVVIVGMFILEYKGTTTVLPDSVLLIMGYYFGQRGGKLNGNGNTQNGQ